MKIGKATPRLRAGVCVVACLFSAFAVAAERRADFAVATGQIEALGISVVALQPEDSLVRNTYPARIVAPPTAEWVTSSPVNGMVKQILVQPGQEVPQGTALMTIASQEFGQLQLDMLQAAARAVLARQSAERERSLHAEGIIPQRRVQEAQAGLKEAEATMRQAQAALRLAGMSDNAINQLVKSAVPLESLTLVASHAGVVSDIFVRPGQRLDPSVAALSISRNDVLWLEVQVPASSLNDWQEGSSVAVSGRDVTAKLLNTSKTVARDSQTVTVRAVIDHTAAALRPGEAVSAELAIDDATQGWNVPLAAVAHEGDQAYVFVRNAQGFEARAVRIAASSGGVARIAGGLSAGDRIAVSGVVALKGAWLNAGESK